MTDLDRLRASRIHPLLGAGVVLLLTYSIGGFRLPWHPIVVSDANSGSALRQFLFTFVAGVATYALLRARGQGALLGQRLALCLGVGLLVGSAAYSDAPTVTVKRSGALGFAGLALATHVHASQAPLRSLQRVVVGLGTGSAVVSLLAAVFLPAACSSIAERPGLAGIAPHPNTLAPCLVVSLMVSLGVNAASPPQRRRLRVSRALMLSSLILTQSMTSLALLAVGVTFWVYLRADRRRGSMQLAGVACLIAAFLSSFFLSSDQLLQAVGRDPSLSGRDVLWSRVVQVGLQEPLFGRGYGAFWLEGRGRDLVGTWNPRQSHNAYLDVFLDLGAVGTIGLGCFGWLGLQRGWRLLVSLPVSSPARSAVASLLALCLGLFAVYGWGESFLLKADKFPFLVLLWVWLLFTNRDRNRLTQEFGTWPEITNSAFARPRRPWRGRANAELVISGRVLSLSNCAAGSSDSQIAYAKPLPRHPLQP